MHGTILYSLSKFVEQEFGAGAWLGVQQKAGLENSVYLPTRVYPDAEVVALVTAAVEQTGRAQGEILEGFGEFITPMLLQMYRALVDPKWKTLDLLQRTEGTIHRVVRMKTPDAEPPHLVSTRPQPDRVVITYDSPRRMCAVGVGIIRGIARHYGEAVDVQQPLCMLRGDARCEIHVRLT